jgi:hypothetical protein
VTVAQRELFEYEYRNPDGLRNAFTVWEGDVEGFDYLTLRALNIPNTFSLADLVRTTIDLTWTYRAQTGKLSSSGMEVHQTFSMAGIGQNEGAATYFGGQLYAPIPIIAPHLRVNLITQSTAGGRVKLQANLNDGVTKDSVFGDAFDPTAPGSYPTGILPWQTGSNVSAVGNGILVPVGATITQEFQTQYVGKAQLTFWGNPGPTTNACVLTITSVDRVAGVQLEMIYKTTLPLGNDVRVADLYLRGMSQRYTIVGDPASAACRMFMTIMPHGD